mmetsp:Transcript_31185/g.51687  ORF Transcript_31185/g.51687 Transcript_31185/m.51687 type:complete len:96 (+) Transcript_31185:946-1233(+)
MAPTLSLAVAVSLELAALCGIEEHPTFTASLSVPEAGDTELLAASGSCDPASSVTAGEALACSLAPAFTAPGAAVIAAVRVGASATGGLLAPPPS